MRFNYWKSTACAALFAASAFLLAPPLRAAEFSADQKAEIGKIVKEYLIGNPEVVKEAIEELDKREKLAEAGAREKTLRAATKRSISPRWRRSSPTAASPPSAGSRASTAPGAGASIRRSKRR